MTIKRNFSDIMLAIMKKCLLILFFITVCSFSLSAQNTSSSFKIVGYYPINQAMKGDTSEVPFDKLTHIMLAL